ncbi:MAG: AraC family transcriptional regulator, partial [Myxococcota bacterium]
TGLSAVRVHQLFKAVQGETFGAFGRRVRLEYACTMMRAHPGRSCTRIALDAGFTESSDFSRSFRRAYGLPPSRWDRSEPLNRRHDRNRQASPGAADEALCVGYPAQPAPMEATVRVVERPALRVAALAVPQATDRDRLRRAFDALETWLAARNQHRADRFMMGLAFDSDLDTPPASYTFELAHPVDAGVLGDAQVLVRALPSSRAAVLACRGDTAAVVASWDHLQRVFVPHCGWQVGRSGSREIYYEDPRLSNMTEWDMDCVIPLEDGD